MNLDTSTIWHQTYLVFGRGLGVSALCAAIPVFTLLYLLGVKRKPAWIAALSGLAVTAVLATIAYRMPIITATTAASDGARVRVVPDFMDRVLGDCSVPSHGRDREIRDYQAVDRIAHGRSPAYRPC